MTFAEWWASVYNKIDHKDILRAAEQAWDAASTNKAKLKEENKMLRMALISMHKACEAFPKGKLRTDDVNKWHYNHLDPSANRLKTILKEIK